MHLFHHLFAATLLFSLHSVHAANVIFTFESNPDLSGPVAPELDPEDTGFTATFGLDAPPSTFGIQPGNADILSFFPDAKIFTNALIEINPFGIDYPLVIQTNQPFTAIQFDWMSYSVPEGGYLIVSDGLGKTQTYFDDGSMTAVIDDFVIGNVAGTALFETSAPVTSITITAWDTHDSPPGSPSVQALGIDNLQFTVVPEPSAIALSLLGSLFLIRQRRPPVQASHMARE